LLFFLLLALLRVVVATHPESDSQNNLQDCGDNECGSLSLGSIFSWLMFIFMGVKNLDHVLVLSELHDGDNDEEVDANDGYRRAVVAAANLQRIGHFN
jgi:hypothetical protein